MLHFQRSGTARVHGEVKQRSAGSVNHRGGVLPAVPVTGLKEESHDGILTQKELGVGTGPAHLCTYVGL